jgi:hypothetical protein
MDGGGTVLMATLTVPHGRRCSLADVLGILRRARRRLLYGSARARLLEPQRIEAVDWTLEIAVKRGTDWHPHYHVLFFVKGAMNPESTTAFREALFRRWCKVVAADEEATGNVRARGVHVRVVDDADRAARYLTKMPLGGTRDAADGGFTLLRDFIEHRGEKLCCRSQACVVCRQFAGAWTEYVNATRRLHRFDAPAERAPIARGAADAPHASKTDSTTFWMYEDAWALTVARNAVGQLKEAVLEADVEGARRLVSHLLMQQGHGSRRARLVSRLWVSRRAPRQFTWGLLRQVSRVRKAPIQSAQRPSARPEAVFRPESG